MNTGAQDILYWYRPPLLNDRFEVPKLARYGKVWRVLRTVHETLGLPYGSGAEKGAGVS